MICIISFQKGYGEDLGIAGLGIEEAALYEPHTYNSLKILNEKFGVNFKKEEELSELSREEKRTIPLLDFSLYKPKKVQKYKHMFGSKTKKTIRKLNNFVPVYNCVKCEQKPADLIVVPTENVDSNEYYIDGMKCYLEDTQYYCEKCRNEWLPRTPGINIARIKFDSTFNFPEIFQEQAFKKIREAAGFDSTKMERKDRREYCEKFVDDLIERTGTGLLFNPHDFLVR
jgi:hypothetical protein